MMPDPSINFMLQNQTRVHFNSGELSSVTYSNTVNTPLVGPLIKVVKQASNLTASLHQSLTFEVVIQNEGNKDANVIFYDILPVGMSFIMNSVLRDGSPLPGANPILGIDVGTVHIGSIIRIVFQAILTTIPNDLKYVNQGSATYEFQTAEGRTIKGTVESNAVEIRVIPYQISLIASTSTVQTFIGDVITYQVSITNQGNVPIKSLRLTIPLPTGVIFVPGSVTIDDIYMPGLSPAEGISLGTLLAGVSLIVKVCLSVTGAPDTNPFVIQSDLYYVAEDMGYSIPANLVKITYIQPNVKVSNQLNTNKIIVGNTLTYTTTVTNEGNFAVEAFLKNTIPRGLSFVSDSLVIDAVSIKGSQLPDTIPLGTLRPGDVVTIQYLEVATPLALQINDGKLSQRSTVVCNFRLSDGRLIQNTLYSNDAIVEVFSALIDILASPKLQMGDLGETLSFQLIITNSGNLEAELRLLHWVQDVPVLVNGTVLMNGNPIVWDHGYWIGSLLPNSSQSITYKGVIPSDIAEEIEETQVYFKCIYEFSLEEILYPGEAKSNYCSVILETNSE